MPIVFNQTFSEDKEVYFPSTWGGHTLPEQLELTKQTVPWLILAKITEISVALLWITLLYAIVVVVSILRQNYLLKNRPEKAIYRKLYRAQVLVPFGIISTACYLLTAVIMVRSQWVRTALAEGGCLWIAGAALFKLYKTYRAKEHNQ